MLAYKKQKFGFTIVELLIVIVVIGILAAIVLNTFSGVQTRAENSKTVEAIKSYAKAMQAYKADNGAFPIANNTYPCLGDMPGNTCGRVTGTNNCDGIGGAGVNSAFDTALRPYLGSAKPAPSSQRMACNGSQVAGAIYNSTDGVGVTFLYFLKGDVPCSAIGGLKVTSRYQNQDTTLCYNDFN